MSDALRIIAAEALRLPGGFLASRGHVGDALGHPVATAEGGRALADFCAGHGLDALYDGADGLLFVRRPDPNRRESTIPPIRPADLKKPASPRGGRRPTTTEDPDRP